MPLIPEAGESNPSWSSADINLSVYIHSIVSPLSPAGSSRKAVRVANKNPMGILVKYSIESACLCWNIYWGDLSPILSPLHKEGTVEDHCIISSSNCSYEGHSSFSVIANIGYLVACSLVWSFYSFMHHIAPPLCVCVGGGGCHLAYTNIKTGASGLEKN